MSKIIKDVLLYDTTLRDGAQGQGVSFSIEDKIMISRRLDQFGMDYIEGGMTNPQNVKDLSFFHRMRSVHLKNAKLVAFGSTRKANKPVGQDPSVKGLLSAQTKAVTVMGKSWLLHVLKVLRTSPQENLAMISSTIAYLKSKGKEVIYDAEHFFEGYLADPKYALKTLAMAEAAGASWIVLCDTNGGLIPEQIYKITREVKSRIRARLGIHTHNDSDCAVANTIEAVRAGATQVQGTINGMGERCGNANLCSVIPNLAFKMGLVCLDPRNLKDLNKVSWYVSELANIAHKPEQPFVGSSAFSHKAGMHVHALQQDLQTYEHLNPAKIGNRRTFLMSGEQSGATSVVVKANEQGIKLALGDPRVQEIVRHLKELEKEGYHFEGAEASFELLVKKTLKKHRKFFDLTGYRVTVEKEGNRKPLCEATIKLKVNGIEEHTAASGDGPVEALDHALRKALEQFYPNLKKVSLIDFKVRVLDASAGSASKVRVLTESTDGRRIWGNVGVSENIIEASWDALVESIEYKLLKDGHK